jgi:hypothetical protein
VTVEQVEHVENPPELARVRLGQEWEPVVGVEVEASTTSASCRRSCGWKIVPSPYPLTISGPCVDTGTPDETNMPSESVGPQSKVRPHFELNGLSARILPTELGMNDGMS